MTKNFCDKCNKEVLDNDGVRINIMGSIRIKFIINSVYLCEHCYGKLEKLLQEALPLRIKEKTI